MYNGFQILYSPRTSLSASLSYSLTRCLYESISFFSFISSRLNRSIKHLPSGEVNDLKLASGDTIKSIYTTIEQRYHRYYWAKSKLKITFTFSHSEKKVREEEKKLLFAKHPFPSHRTPLYTLQWVLGRYLYTFFRVYIWVHSRTKVLIFGRPLAEEKIIKARNWTSIYPKSKKKRDITNVILLY